MIYEFLGKKMNIIENTLLPIVDISDLSSTNIEKRLSVAALMDNACRQSGFLHIKSSNFDKNLFKQLLEVAKQYFAQEEAVKMQHYIGKSQNHSGYVPIGEEQFKPNSHDIKEAYDINIDYLGDTECRSLVGKNQWPDSLIFKETVQQYYQHIRQIGHQIFRALALALGLTETYFDEHLTFAPSQLRLIHYPYNPNAQDSLGIGSHTDYEFFTLLLPTAPGLQVLSKNGEWLDVPLIENTLVMNIGDMMQVISNGQYIATKHRVKKVQEERYAFPFFFSCNYDFIVKPLIDTAHPKYPAIKCGEHLFNQTVQSFNYLKKRLQNGELVMSNDLTPINFGLAESVVHQ